MNATSVLGDSLAKGLVKRRCQETLTQVHRVINRWRCADSRNRNTNFKRINAAFIEECAPFASKTLGDGKNRVVYHFFFELGPDGVGYLNRASVPFRDPRNTEVLSYIGHSYLTEHATQRLIQSSFSDSRKTLGHRIGAHLLVVAQELAYFRDGVFEPGYRLFGNDLMTVWHPDNGAAKCATVIRTDRLDGENARIFERLKVGLPCANAEMLPERIDVLILDSQRGPHHGT